MHNTSLAGQETRAAAEPRPFGTLRVDMATGEAELITWFTRGWLDNPPAPRPSTDSEYHRIIPDDQDLAEIDHLEHFPHDDHSARIVHP